VKAIVPSITFELAEIATPIEVVEGEVTTTATTPATDFRAASI
jgi:hypothetical protein